MTKVKHKIDLGGGAFVEIGMADTYFKYMSDEEIMGETGVKLDVIKEMRKKYEGLSVGEIKEKCSR